MFSLKKLIKRGPKGKQGLVVQSQDAQTMLALGLHWAPEISASGRHASESAQKARATHMLKAPGMTAHVRLVGLAKNHAQPIYAAALLAAQRLGQTDGTYALTVPTGQVWVSIVSAGIPTSEQLLDHQTAVSQAATWTGHIYTDLDPLLSSRTQAPTSTNAERYSFADLLTITPPSFAILNPVPRKRLMSGIPRPLLWALAAGLIYFAQSFALEQWQTSVQQAKQAQAAEQRLLQQEEAKVAWRVKVKNELAQRSQQIDLSALRESINKMPVLWQGWSLESASCEAKTLKKSNQGPSAPASVVSHTKTWMCAARYNAPDAKHGATITPNNVLIAPPGMSIEYAPTKRASLLWQIETPATPLTLDVLPPQDYHRVTTSSLLQANASALSSLPDIVLSAWRIEAPKIDGIAAPMPQDLVLPLSAPLNLKSSLPVIDRLQSQLKADWQKLVLTTSQDQVGIEAELTGVLYAK